MWGPTGSLDTTAHLPAKLPLLMQFFQKATELTHFVVLVPRPGAVYVPGAALRKLEAVNSAVTSVIAGWSSIVT